ncbi:MAG: hypothetical protein IPK19_10855 [Chloroflexi bacterium]|nr:hypothetical protein [Chloroflexota bacterium]
MPTIFERINAALTDNDVSVRVTVQSDNLTSIATTVANLIENPPSSLGDLGALLQALPLPDLAISDDFGMALNQLAAMVPGDLSGITGGLSGNLGALQEQLGALTGPLGEVIEVVLAVYALTQVDFLCATTPSPPGGTPPGGGSPPPAEPPPGQPPPAPVQQLNTIIDLFPNPLTVSSLLEWIYQVLRDFDLSEFQIVQVPILDDLRDPLATLIEWRNAMNSAALLDQMNDTLDLLETTIIGSVSSVLAPIDAALNTISVGLPTTQLIQIADELVTHLGTLRTAIQSGDLSATGPAVSAINALLDTYSGIQVNVQNNLALPFATLDDRLASLDIDLDTAVGRLVSLVQPESLFSFIPLPSQSALSLAGLGEFEEWLDTLVGWIGDLTDSLDLSAIQEPLGTVADALQSAVDAIDAAMISITLQVQSLFGDVEDLLDQIDPGALLDEVQDAIDSFQTALVAAQEPVRPGERRHRHRHYADRRRSQRL